eukprot:scaffold52421_cov57-Phaeocystis_antarctica.AAC.4
MEAVREHSAPGWQPLQFVTPCVDTYVPEVQGSLPPGATRTSGAGQLAPGEQYCAYAVRVPVLDVPRTTYRRVVHHRSWAPST